MRFIAAKNTFGEYCVPESAAHRPAARAVLAGKIYEADTITFLRGNTEGGDVIHAGTFFGDFLPALSSCANHVWAFEPNPESFECATYAIDRNNLSNVTLVHAAVSEVAGELSLKVADDSGRALGGASHLVSLGESGSVAVPSVRIDDAVPESSRVTVFHLDVEGHETPAIAGAMKIIRRNRPIIVLETDINEPIAQDLKHLGYRRFGHVGVNVIYAVSRPKVMPTLTRRLTSGFRLILSKVRPGLIR